MYLSWSKTSSLKRSSCTGLCWPKTLYVHIITVKISSREAWPLGISGDGVFSQDNPTLTCALGNTMKSCYNLGETIAVGGVGADCVSRGIAGRSSVGATCHLHEIDDRALGDSPPTSRGVAGVHAVYQAAQKATKKYLLTPFREVTPI
jgi:hypothetical protein